MTKGALLLVRITLALPLRRPLIILVLIEPILALVIKTTFLEKLKPILELIWRVLRKDVVSL